MADDLHDDILESTLTAESEETAESLSSRAIQAISSEAAESTWLVPYGNMVTVLMIFFLVLYAFSQQKSSTFERAIEEIRSEISTEIKQEARQRKKEAEAAQSLETFLDEKKLNEYIQVEVSAQRIRVSLSNPVLYGSGRAGLKSSAHEALNEIASLLKGIPNPVIVEGHTDNVPIRSGRHGSNFELSAARAFAVIEYFLKQGLDPARFSVFGYGEFRPVADNGTEEGRGKNRRIEINIVRTGETT